MSAIDAHDYNGWLVTLKERIRVAQTRAIVAVNTELVMLYWYIGRDILDRQARQGWGAKVVDQLAADLRQEFPEMKGFSSRNLKYMRAFAQAWPDSEIVQQAVAQLPWGHNVRILDGLSNREHRLWYVKAAIQYGWSRNVLVHQIETRLHERQGAAPTNFKQALPAPQSELAQQLTKDPYIFDFMTLAGDVKERALEDGLIQHLQAFLLELGKGFAFVGRQYHLDVGDQDFYIDLLFFNIPLNCYVVIELKTGEFKPEYAGKMQFYVAAIDAEVKLPSHNKTIGLILCKTKNGVMVDYTLRETQAPIGVSAYHDGMPPEIAQALPTIEQLEAEFSKQVDLNGDDLLEESGK